MVQETGEDHQLAVRDSSISSNPGIDQSRRYVQMPSQVIPAQLQPGALENFSLYCTLLHASSRARVMPIAWCL
jgi:hypothetical protein